MCWVPWTSKNCHCRRQAGAVTGKRGEIAGGGRQHYPVSGLVGLDVRVGIWSTAWRPFLQSREEGIAAAAAMVGATLPTMTMHGDAVVREKDRASYHALFWDLEGCSSHVRDVGYRTPDGGWLGESALNL